MQLKNLERLSRHWSVWKGGYQPPTIYKTPLKYQVPTDHIQLYLINKINECKKHYTILRSVLKSACFVYKNVLLNYC